MTPRIRAAAAAALLAAVPLPGRAADATVPVRTLTYTVALSTTGRFSIAGGRLTDGSRPLRGEGGSAMRPSLGDGDSHGGASFATKGVIHIAVVQATGDAGLVVDVDETTTMFSRTRVRFGVNADGTLFFDPKDARNIGEEEIVLVRWLARGFYGDRPTELGTAWAVDLSGNGRVDLERYRVLARDAARVTLAYSFEERSTSVTRPTGTREGSLVYDTALAVPVKATYDTDARREIGDTYETVRSAVVITLTNDSFAKPG